MIRPSASVNKLPLTILVLGIIAALIGLLAIFDASVVEAYKDFGDKFHFIKQQGTWLVIGITAALITSNIPISFIKKYINLFFLVTLFLMLIVLIPGIGPKLLGARRWIIVGPIVLQPSELLKISLILYLSRWFELPKDLKHFLVLVFMVLGLIMLQPDLGTAIVVIMTCFTMYYVSGAPLKSMTTFVALLIISVSLLILVSPYRMNRLKTYMDPTSDPLGASYHINQVLYGLGSGGFTGVGIGKSRQKFAYLPEATTDSIFVIIAEEFGFLGGTILIVTMIAMILLSFQVAIRASNRFDKLMSCGVSLLFLNQIFINLGSMTAIVPLTGVPLPFISYGGSSLVTNFIALGLLINAAKRI